jgi:hypothetical protein
MDEQSAVEVAVSNKWAEVKALVDSLELDVLKNAKGNASAGVRVRKGLRLLKKVAGELVKATAASDKQIKTARNVEKAAKKAAKAS